jgi:hypothetical protein
MDQILSCPAEVVYSSSTRVTVYSPCGNWYDYTNYQGSPCNTIDGYTRSYRHYDTTDPICNDFASDSYLSGLMWGDGTPMPVSEVTYKTKVFKVERAIC